MKKFLFSLLLLCSLTMAAQQPQWPTYDNKTHSALEQPFADLSQQIWDMMGPGINPPER